MLYNPEWKVETKPDPLSLEGLVAWLEKQPAHQPYCYTDTGECLAALYNASICREYKVVFIWDGGQTFDHKLERIACGEPRTFGAALSRARAYRDR